MRRHELGFAKLVEAVLHVIGRQQAGEVKLHPEEITNRVGVFSAGEPLEGIDRAPGEDAFWSNCMISATASALGCGAFPAAFRRPQAR